MRIIAALAAVILIVASGGRVVAAPTPPMPPTISVQGDGEVDYTPDEARVTLGVNGEDASAAAATADIAGRANAVIAALKSLGIPAGSITTSGFNLYYRQATETVKAAFVASESVSVKAPVDKTGAAIDAGIRAGANQTYGLSYETTQRDALYKQAVQRAVKQARDLADAVASAAGVRLGAVISISVGGASPPPFAPVARMTTMAMAAPAPPPISPGTGTMTATVSVTYSIAMPGSSHP
ncbi:MAG TPA: SIMPL domain-containing protein [Candidatus Eremiobacteraceae bacterium]|jgi:hypothetical protein|nr:SIMPL domain-containing protein [Candidatus Eremiobacteraceae bacterium]